MSNYPLGVSVIEGVSAGLTPFTSSSKYNIGLLFERERGIAFKPARVLSLQDDRKVFGGLSNNKFGAYITRHIFKNAQNFGAIVYGVRVIDVANSVTASGMFTDGALPVANIFKVWAGQGGLKDMGTWANGLTVKCFPKNHINGVVNKYLFQVTYQGAQVESWEAATWQELITAVNDRSGYVMLEPIDLTKTITDIQTVILSGGVYAKPTDAMYLPVPSETTPTGLACLDSTDIQMVSICEVQTLATAQAGKAYCNAHTNKPLFVYSLPFESTTTIVESFANAMQTATADCSAGYNFWVKTSDEQGGYVWTPSVGVILGAGFIRVAGLNRDLIHFPPAGVESAFIDVVDVSPNALSNTLATLWVKRFSTNVAIYRTGKGFFLWSSRTNSTNNLYQSIHTRRVVSYYVRQLETNLLWVIQKPTTPELKRQAYVSIYSYFLSEYGNGALEQSIPFEQACVISVTQDVNDRKNLLITIDIILTECTESVRINLNRNDNSLVGTI
jgi:hypothetical protein